MSHHFAPPRRSEVKAKPLPSPPGKLGSTRVKIDPITMIQRKRNKSRIETNKDKCLLEILLGLELARQVAADQLDRRQIAVGHCGLHLVDGGLV